MLYRYIWICFHHEKDNEYSYKRANMWKQIINNEYVLLKRGSTLASFRKYGFTCTCTDKI